MNLALFDLDGTLLPIDSDHAFGEFMVALGWADGDELPPRATTRSTPQYQAGRLDIDAYVDFATAPWRDRPADELAAATPRFMRRGRRARRCTPAALALVRRHQRAGDLVAIVTATNEFVTRPIAALLRRATS